MLPTLSPEEIKTLLKSSETQAVLQTITSAGTLTAILEELRDSPDLTNEKLEIFWDSTDFFNRLPALMDKSFNLEEVLESLPPHQQKKFWQLPNLLEKLANLSTRQDKNKYDWHTFKLEHIVRYIPEDKAEAFLNILEYNLIENEHDLYKVLHALSPQQEIMRALLLKLPHVQNWSYTKKVMAIKHHEDHSKLLSRSAILVSLCVGFALAGFLLSGIVGLVVGVIIGIVVTIAALLMATTQLAPSSAIAVWTVVEPPKLAQKK
jgi:hypothetical protein